MRWGWMAAAGIACALVLGACGPAPGRDSQTPDSVATGAVPVADLPPDAPVVYLNPEVRRACTAAAAYWKAEPRVQLRVFDSTLTLPGSTAVADACWVAVRLDDDRATRPPESDAQRVPFVASGWLPVYEFDADGKDGRSRVYQLDPVRCLAEERWDGGDDADSTYVPAPWFEQRVACWRR